MTDVMFDAFGAWLLDGLGDACGQVVDGLLGFLSDSTSVSFTDGWWVRPAARDVTAVVAALSAVLMVACLLAATLQGLLAGDAIGMLRAAAVEVPLSVAGTAALGGVATLLVQATDAVSAAVLDGAQDSLGRLAGVMVARGMTGDPLAALGMALFALGALLLWLELIVRESLLYLLVAAAPLLLAARVWPAVNPSRTAW